MHVPSLICVYFFSIIIYYRFIYLFQGKNDKFNLIDYPCNVMIVNHLF